MVQSAVKRLVVVMSFIAGFMLAAQTMLQAAEYVSVNKEGVNFRSGPGTKYSAVFELPLNYPLRIVEKKGEWLKVSDFENDKGWIFAPLVSKKKYVIVTVQKGNVRSGAGRNYDDIGDVFREVILEEVKRDGDWVQIRHPKLKGWVHRKLVWP